MRGSISIDVASIRLEMSSNWLAYYDVQVKAEASSDITAKVSPVFRGGGNSVSLLGEFIFAIQSAVVDRTQQLGFKNSMSGSNGEPPPQHTYGMSMAGIADASNINGGFLYSNNTQRQSSYGIRQAPIGNGYRGRGHSAIQYPNQNLTNPYKYVAPKPTLTKDDVMEKPMRPEEVALLNKFLHKKVDLMRNSGIDISLDRNDPRSPLHSIHSFRDLRLRPELLEALNVLGFSQPSKIQEFALPLLIMEPPTNIIAQSQSGTGKTATFVLTMLSRVDPSQKHPQCICLAPTYELAIQIGDVVSKIAQFMPEVKVHFAVRGTKPSAPIVEQIVIGTPGKLVDYLTKYRCLDSSHIRCLVLDEADVMINQAGYAEQSTLIYNTIEAGSPGVQTMLFSATYGEDVVKFAMQLIKNAVTVTRLYPVLLQKMIKLGVVDRRRYIMVGIEKQGNEISDVR
ncbi:DEAD/DEAH box helicase [Dictyocaulus viviparus]|uniref:RNA helicase n=1 Tax=Dictyocaulus viviparus TaxID=29172 RepID=A0A0D8XPG0_DICVI|nr:DEAD/DEAH box helicase [Dictyocaulus viviparus]